MKYFVVEVTSTDNEVYAKGITEKDDLDEAKMLFHQVMAAAYANPEVLYAMCIIVNEYGANEMIEIKRVVIEPEPEPTPDPEPEPEPEEDQATE